MSRPTLDDVLESFLLDRTDETVVQRYSVLYPEYAVELFDLEHEVQREISDEAPVLAPALRPVVEGAMVRVQAAWPTEAPGARDLFAALTPADYGKLSNILDVPRQVVAAVRNRRAIPETIPRGFLRRMADALSGSIEDLLASMAPSSSVAASYKSTGDVVTQPPVPFEQILIEARVPPERLAQIMSEND